MLSGAEVVRGPVSFVRPPEITYADELQISLGGKRVNMTWVGEMNHSTDSSMITFPDDGVMLIVDYVTFGRVPNREMDYELGMFEEWMTAIVEAESWQETLISSQPVMGLLVPGKTSQRGASTWRSCETRLPPESPQVSPWKRCNELSIWRSTVTGPTSSGRPERSWMYHFLTD